MYLQNVYCYFCVMFMNYIDKNSFIKKLFLSTGMNLKVHYVFAQKVTYDKSFCFPFELDMQAKLFFSCF